MSTRFIGIVLDLPDAAASVPLCRRVLRGTLSALSVEEGRAADIEMVLSEATANVVRHAYAQPGNRYRVSIDFFVNRVRLVVEDRGHGFARSAVSVPDEGQVGGWGLWLIERLADGVTFSTCPNGGTRLEVDFCFSHSLSFSLALDPIAT
jgi:anti-sigma regulatory factor (Ser/Thr protein kinase)